MSQNKVRVGILGAAKIARKTIKAIQDAESSIECVAIASRTYSKARQLADELDVHVQIFTSYDSLIEDKEIDAVYICIPSALHCEYIEKAVNNNKHILVEKPLATTPQDLDTVYSLFTMNQSLQYMDGAMWLHNPRMHVLREILDQQVPENIGQIRKVYTHLSFPASEDFLQNDIRVKKNLESLGVIGDLGWYAVGIGLFAFKYNIPIALQVGPGFKLNNEGVAISLTAKIMYSEYEYQIMDISFESIRRQYVELTGDTGTINYNGFVTPMDESKLTFERTWNHTVQGYEAEINEVESSKRQEVIMWENFSKAVKDIQEGEEANDMWLRIAVLTNQIVLALQQSVDNNGEYVELKN